MLSKFMNYIFNTQIIFFKQYKMRPTIKHFVSISLRYTIGLLALLTVVSLYRPDFPILSFIDISAIKWILSVFIITVFFLSRLCFFDKENEKNMLAVSLLLFWMAICIIRGFFAIETNWDWKGLFVNAVAILLPVVAFSATNKKIVQSLLSFYIKYTLPLFFILIPLIITDAYGRYLMPISFLLLFLPALSNKQRYLLLFFTAIVFLANLNSRSHVIKFGIPFIILIIYYFKDKISCSTLEIIRITLIITPIVFFILGATQVFNVFNISKHLGDYTIKATDFEGTEGEYNLSTDTRTFLYFEVIQSAIKNEYVFFGRTPARGNDSESFGKVSYENTGRDERLGNEVGILNVFTWTGITGVILYLFVFFNASYLAVNHSKNIYSKMLGIYVAFRWLWSWVEDINNFSLNYFILWIMIGLCFSYSFRMMSNYEVTIWIRGVFDHRYLHFEKYLKRERNEK